MIKSCSECKTKCCKTGPGPYKSVSVNDWLTHKDHGSKRYNTKCEHFDENNETCKIWKNAPLACKTFICSVRSYNRSELREIDRIWRKHGT